LGLDQASPQPTSYQRFNPCFNITHIPTLCEKQALCTMWNETL